MIGERLIATAPSPTGPAAGRGVFIGFNSVLFNCVVGDGSVALAMRWSTAASRRTSTCAHRRPGLETALAGDGRPLVDASEFSEDVGAHQHAGQGCCQNIQNEI